jgi:8-oxo-dGTP pyrophosphatase MutT (NUDIX family)
MNSIRIGDTSSLDKQRRVNTSAGCYLIRKTDTGIQLLIIKKTFPNGDVKYVLPKGHKEGDETLEEVAHRETVEESGYTDFRLLKYIGSVTYELDWDEIQMKTDHYFLALVNSDKQIERKPEVYEKDVNVENVWMEIEEGFKYFTNENLPELNSFVKSLLKNMF